MRIFEDPVRTGRVCGALGKLIRESFGQVDMVVSPAIGGIIPGYETARALGCKAVFVEREDGEFQLRRGFEVPEGARIVMVEDIVTTGLSSRECIAAIRKTGAKVVAACCLIDRSGGKAKVGVPLIALAEWKVQAWPAGKLPPHLRGTKAVKPGSRGLA